MKAALILPFAAAILMVLLTSGGGEARSATKQLRQSSQCPEFPPGMVTICVVGPNWCSNSTQCSNGQICCQRGCGSECMDPVPVEDDGEGDQDEGEDQDEGNQDEGEGDQSEAEEGGESTDRPDPCLPFSSIMPLIFCRQPVHRCEADDQCPSGRICCPFANCGNKCIYGSRE